MEILLGIALEKRDVMIQVRTKKMATMSLSFPASLNGLCNDCVYSPNCSLKTPSSVVFNCEEYDSLPISKKKTIEHHDENNSTNLIGLCANCDHVKTCALRQPESVIFNCEHYQ